MEQLAVDTALGLERLQERSSPRTGRAHVPRLVEHHEEMIGGAARDADFERAPPDRPPRHQGGPRPPVGPDLAQHPLDLRTLGVGERLPAFPPENPAGRHAGDTGDRRGPFRDLPIRSDGHHAQVEAVEQRLGVHTRAGGCKKGAWPRRNGGGAQMWR